MQDGGTREVACCTNKFTYGLVTIGRIFRSPCFLAVDFVLSHMCTRSKDDCRLITNDFNTPCINWKELTTLGGYFDGSQLTKTVQWTLALRTTRPIDNNLEHELSFLDIVFAHHCDNFTDITYFAH